MPIIDKKQYTDLILWYDQIPGRLPKTGYIDEHNCTVIVDSSLNDKAVCEWKMFLCPTKIRLYLGNGMKKGFGQNEVLKFIENCQCLIVKRKGRKKARTYLYFWIAV